MYIEHEMIFGRVLDKALEEIFDWSFSEDHPLNQCTTDVQEHVKVASNLARQERYDEAIAELTKASEKDPHYIGTRVRTMKYLSKDERPLLGLLIGGGVLVLTKDAKPQSQVWDMASGVALDLFKQTNHTREIREALAFANKATRLAPDDILSGWNRVEVLLNYAAHTKKEGNVEEANKLLDLAKGAVESILDLGRNRRSNTYRYWPRLVEDAKKVFPEVNGGVLSSLICAKSMKVLRTTRRPSPLQTPQPLPVSVVSTGSVLLALR